MPSNSVYIMFQITNLEFNMIVKNLKLGDIINNENY